MCPQIYKYLAYNILPIIQFLYIVFTYFNAHEVALIINNVNYIFITKNV